MKSLKNSSAAAKSLNSGVKTLIRKATITVALYFVQRRPKMLIRKSNIILPTSCDATQSFLGTLYLKVSCSLIAFSQRLIHANSD